MILSCWGQIAYLISVQHCQTNTPDSLSKLILLWYYCVRIAFLMHILLWVWVFWSGFKRQEDTSLRHIYDSWRTKASIGERFERDGGKTKRLFFLPYSLNLALWLADGGTNKSQVQVFLIQGALPSASLRNRKLRGWPSSRLLPSRWNQSLGLNIGHQKKPYF